MAKTPKSVALGSALRQARKSRNLSLRDFAAQISRDPGMLSRWETGERTPKPEHVAQILTTLGVTGERYDDVMTLVQGTGEPRWVATTIPEQRQQMAAFLEFEQNATEIVAWTPMLIPGLLQTTEYIRAVMTAGGVPVGEIATRVAVRIGRREVLTKPKPAKLIAFVSQAALHQDVGGRAAGVDQLRHLVAMSKRSNIELRLVPHGIGWHPGMEGEFTLIDSEESSAVFLGTLTSTLWLHQHADIDAYRRAADVMLEAALTAEQSRRYIAGLAQRMENSGNGSDMAQVDSKPERAELR